MIFRQVQAEQFDIVAKARKVGADNLQAAAIILKEAVIDGRSERNQLENRKGDEERRDENIAPFRVAD